MIERNLDLLKVERRVTNLSDLMSDVGGFFGLLVMSGRAQKYHSHGFFF